ncbi:hypothetical protein MG293_020327 [Ovis ammon polii]|uniref:Uncharacterized protein n=1 Tax=Ovis ammon polii TaxID=230172 RepID=A0AAD4TNQ3_OVIAM|nr:hypothetical protein MG293_020327 [Ovis ammon polii]
MGSFNSETGHFKERHGTVMSQTLSVFEGWLDGEQRGKNALLDAEHRMNTGEAAERTLAQPPLCSRRTRMRPTIIPEDLFPDEMHSLYERQKGWKVLEDIHHEFALLNMNYPLFLFNHFYGSCEPNLVGWKRELWANDSQEMTAHDVSDTAGPQLYIPVLVPNCFKLTLTRCICKTVPGMLLSVILGLPQ